jgi:hypothetical protein
MPDGAMRVGAKFAAFDANLQIAAFAVDSVTRCK